MYLSVKFSYVTFISQVCRYFYDTLNVLFTSHFDNRQIIKLVVVLPYL
jgi:hypothetical protein